VTFNPSKSVAFKHIYIQSKLKLTSHSVNIKYSKTCSIKKYSIVQRGVNGKYQNLRNAQLAQWKNEVELLSELMGE